MAETSPVTRLSPTDDEAKGRGQERTKSKQSQTVKKLSPEQKQWDCFEFGRRDCSWGASWAASPLERAVKAPLAARS